MLLNISLSLFCTYCLWSFVASKDYCIIGAGPSGLQMAYFLERAGRDYIIYERDSTPGWFYKIYPRHRTLISINKRYTGKTNKEFNLRHDWNSLLSDNDDLLMTKYSKDFLPKADTFVQYLNDYARTFNLKTQYKTYIKNVSKSDGIYTLTDKKGGSYKCKYLLVSTGLWVENLPRNVDGIEHTEGYPKMSVDPEDFAGQTILILGRGNSAFETAQNLMGYANLIHLMSRSRLRFSWETHYVGDVRAVNCGAIDTYQLKSLDGQLEGDLQSIKIIKKNGKLYMVFKSVEEGLLSDLLPDNLATRDGYDRILRCTGFKFDRSIFTKDIRPKFSPILKKYPQIKANYESVTSDNMFFTGASTHSLDWRKSAGGFIHGFRYTTRTLHRYLEWKNHGIHWPSVVLPNKDLINYILKRLNEASGIYQMVNAICDVLVFRENDTFEYFEELGTHMLPQFEEHTGRPFTRGIVLNLEYGKNFSGPGSDPFREDRATGEAQEAHTSNFLHPVLYYYEGSISELTVNGNLGRPLRLHHMVEDFLTEWIAPVAHILPLRWYLEHCTGGDLRKFFAETCFQYAMTGMNAPPSCERDYLKGRGLPKPAQSMKLPTEEHSA